MENVKKVVVQDSDYSTIVATILTVTKKGALISLTQDRKMEKRFDHIILSKEQIKVLYELSIGKK